MYKTLIHKISSPLSSPQSNQHSLFTEEEAGLERRQGPHPALPVPLVQESWRDGAGAGGDARGPRFSQPIRSTVTADRATVALCSLSSTSVGYTDEELLSFSQILPWVNSWTLRKALCIFRNRERRGETRQRSR